MKVIAHLTSPETPVSLAEVNMHENPTINVIHDYDGFFESVVRDWMTHKDEFNHHTVNIDSGPYRPHAVGFHSEDGVLTLDFYSALRAGFGSLSENERETLIDKL